MLAAAFFDVTACLYFIVLRCKEFGKTTTRYEFENRGDHTRRTTMLCRGLLIFTALSLVVVNSPSARADLCFRYVTTGGGTLVMQGVTLPAPNTCQPVAMYEASQRPGRFALTELTAGPSSSSTHMMAVPATTSSQGFAVSSYQMTVASPRSLALAA